MTTLPDLLARLEGAEGPSRELDALIWPLNPGFRRREGIHFADWDREWEWRKTAAQPVTASLDAALALCERVLPGASKQITIRDAKSIVRLARRDMSAIYGEAKTPALALVAAIVKALAAQQSAEAEADNA